MDLIWMPHACFLELEPGVNMLYMPLIFFIAG